MDGKTRKEIVKKEALKRGWLFVVCILVIDMHTINAVNSFAVGDSTENRDFDRDTILENSAFLSADQEYLVDSSSTKSTRDTGQKLGAANPAINLARETDYLDMCNTPEIKNRANSETGEIRENSESSERTNAVLSENTHSDTMRAKDSDPFNKPGSKQDLTLTKVNNKVQRDEELFLQGNSFYHQREYGRALSCYDAIKDKGRAVFYNSGNCYYYMHKPCEAFVAWCRARTGATYKEYDASVAACCALKEELSSGAYEQKLVEIGDVAQGKLCRGSFFERLYTPFSLFTLQVLFGCLWYIFFLLLYFFKRKFKRSGLFLLYLLCILMFMFFVGLGVVVKYKQEWYPQAVVRVQRALLLAGPHKKYPVLRVLQCMEEVVVREKMNGWCRLEISNVSSGSSGGWIEDTEIEIVE